MSHSPKCKRSVEGFAVRWLKLKIVGNVKIVKKERMRTKILKRRQLDSVVVRCTCRSVLEMMKLQLAKNIND